MDGSEPGERSGGEHPGRGAARESAIADRVAAAAAELYGAGTAVFTDRRKALAAEARTAGDRRAATAIAALRKPTRAAWVVNQLARADPGAPSRLAAMAAALRAAEQARDGPRLRELSPARGALIDTLTERALDLAGTPDPPTSLRAEVAATLTAALADPEVAAAFAAGTLDRAAHWSGFGAADFGAADPAAAGLEAPGAAPARASDADAAGPRVDDGSDPGADSTGGSERTAPTPPKAAPAPIGRPGPRRSPVRRDAPGPATAAPVAPHPRGQVAARIAAAEDQRQARAAAERSARERSNHDDAERTVAAAATAAAEALAAEDRLEAEVRDLEERLIRARADLTAARLTARRAESAERRARQALDRLPRP